MKVIIVGGGQVGSYLATLLLKDGYSVKVVEMREKQIHNLYHDLPAEAVVEGDFTDPKVLEAADIHQADVVVAATPTDEGNLVVATLARFEFGVKRIIAVANNPKNTWMFTPEMGVDVAITEADLIAHVVAEEMSLGDMMTLLKLNKGQFSIVQEKIHSSSIVAGKMIRDLHVPAECILVAIIRKKQVTIPRGDTVLMVDDEVIALVSASQARALADLMGATL
ncbi:MAG: TrkA family potassium uptake protein [Firmicutes bacterium]|nr:TrkA family potassium uptake protein [Bacillota bacterium]